MEGVRYKASEGQLGRVMAIRLLPRTDLTEGIKKICEDYGVQHGFISCSMGSLQKATFMVTQPKPEAKMKVGYTDPIEVPGPVEFLGGHGWIGESEDGGRLIHFHGIVTDQTGKSYGGHFVEGGNRSLLTIDLIIIELKGVRLVRKYDDEVGLIELDFLK